MAPQGCGNRLRIHGKTPGSLGCFRVRASTQEDVTALAGIADEGHDCIGLARTPAFRSGNVPVRFAGLRAFVANELGLAVRIELEAEIPAHSEFGLSGRETRRSLGDTLRLSLRYTSVEQVQTDLRSIRAAVSR